MKKTVSKRNLRLVLLALGLVAVLILGLVACDRNNPSTNETTGTATEEAPSENIEGTPSDSHPVGEPTDKPVDSSEDPDESGDPEETTLPPVDSGDGVITRPPVITLPSLDPDGSVTSEPEETLPYDPSLHPGNSDDYNGVMISAVYGTGKKNTDAAMESGFVQLYNTSMYTVSLKGASLYYKSDGASPFEQFVFPEDATIAPGGYYLVKCKSVANYDTSMAVIGMEYYDAEWDTTFDNHEIRLLLAPSGWAIGRDENILLFDDAISVFVATESYSSSVYAVDGMSKNKIAVRTALKDYSGYHTVNLAERATGELQKVAPAASGNRVNPVISPRINEVTFSQPAGVYDTAFNLTLKAKEGYKIYYTTDGSDPKVSGKQYTSAIKLADSSKMTWGPTIKACNQYIGGGAAPSSSTLPGGYVIKAYATNGTDSTPVYTNTYFVIPELCDYGVTVMSISIPVNEMFGNEGFYNNYLLTGSITGGRRRGTAIMEVFNTDGDRVGNSTVELAVSGNGSSGFTMKSLRVYYKGALNEDGGREGNLDYDLFEGRAKDQYGQVITTFDRLLLRNSGNDCGVSYIRDAYMQRVCAGLNVDTMASASTLVFINGEFWGVYNIRERYSPEYVESHYGVDKENVAVIESDYSQVHTNHMADYVVSSGIEGDADPFNAMTAYMRSHDLSDPEAYAYVCSQMDIDSFIDMWVTRLFFVARDWPENNIKVWRNRNPEDPSGFDTKWHYTLLDMDMGLSFYDFTTEKENFFWAMDSGSVCGQMMRDLLRNPGFKEQFILRYHEVINDYLTADYLSAEFEVLVAERDPLMPLQDKRWNDSNFSISSWNSAVSRIRSFIQNRQSLALNHMYSRFGISEGDIESLSSRRVTISYNPDRVSVYINGEAVSNGTQFRFEDKEREFEVKVTVKAGYTLNGIVWAPNSGSTQREDTSTTVKFKVTSSGTISIYAKWDKSGPADTAGQLIAGPSYMFYLTGNGELYAWGDNRGGVLALDSEDGVVATPTFVMSNVAKVSTTQGSNFEGGDKVWMTAILTKDGKLYTVGRNTCGQLGRNGTADDTRLDLVSFNGKIVDVSVGYDHMLIVDEKGVMWGIGSNSNGQLGSKNQGGTTQTFQKVAENVSMASAGRRSTVYVDDNGKLYGLGDNRWKKLSQNHGDVVTTPVLMLENVKYIDSGEHQMLAVTEKGDLYYAGWRDFNSFTQGGGNNPTLRKVMSGVEKADIYFSNMIILTENGDAYVYGLNQDGGMGASAVTGGTPKKIYSGVTDVAAGYGFTAYFCDDGSIRILGDNTYGQGGTGKTGGQVNFSEADV